MWNLRSNALRPDGWTSADAAGLAIFPGLVRYDEVFGTAEITHAFRFSTRSTNGYVWPASHAAGSTAGAPPMGMRLRLKKSFNVNRFPPQSRVILKAMKKYGMLLADNGSGWYVSGAPDPRWNDEELATLRNVRGRDFQVVRMGTIVTN